MYIYIISVNIFNKTNLQTQSSGWCASKIVVNTANAAKVATVIQERKPICCIHSFRKALVAPFEHKWTLTLPVLRFACATRESGLVQSARKRVVEISWHFHMSYP